MRDKPFFMGGEPTGVDASMFASSPVSFATIFARRRGTRAGRHNKLRGYVGRTTARYYPEYAEIAGWRRGVKD